MYKDQEATKKLLNRKDVAEYLGISGSKAHQLLHSVGFPTVRIDRRIFANKDLLDLWIDNQTVKAVDSNE